MGLSYTGHGGVEKPELRTVTVVPCPGPCRRSIMAAPSGWVVRRVPSDRHPSRYGVSAPDSAAACVWEDAPLCWQCISARRLPPGSRLAGQSVCEYVEGSLGIRATLHRRISGEEAVPLLQMTPVWWRSEGNAEFFLLNGDGTVQWLGPFLSDKEQLDDFLPLPLLRADCSNAATITASSIAHVIPSSLNGASFTAQQNAGDLLDWRSPTHDAISKELFCRCAVQPR